MNQVGVKCERVGAMVHLKASIKLDNKQQQKPMFCHGGDLELVSYEREWKTSTINKP